MLIGQYLSLKTYMRQMMRLMNYLKKLKGNILLVDKLNILFLGFTLTSRLSLFNEELFLFYLL